MLSLRFIDGRLPRVLRVAAALITSAAMVSPIGNPPPASAANAGTALQFNGSSQYATLGAATDLRTPQFTLELWLKRTGAGVGTSTGSGGIASAIPLITKGRAEGETAAADVNYFFGIDATSGKLVADFEEAQVAQGGTTPGLNHPITGGAIIPADNSWHHAAVTYDGTTWNLYLDGNPDGTLAVGRTPNTATTAVTAVGSSLN
ncbi:MAG TPA: LamG-like jellyroll fold domain-containing protein, partial [Patescibacteria group bacterium]|nr:LamG-like jellyroll fold domain-containing protein [Patescibacteria group bacterium]